jgi:hypothetical protein
LEEKSPWWLFTGVDAVADAILIYDQSRCMGSTPIEDAMRIDAEANARSTNRKSMQTIDDSKIERCRKGKGGSGEKRINRRYVR